MKKINGIGLYNCLKRNFRNIMFINIRLKMNMYLYLG